MPKKLTYEAAAERLAEIVKILEDGGKTLDESVKLFEEGAALSKFCNEKLSEAERKIMTLDEANDCE